MNGWCNRMNELYVLMLSLHGLIRGNDLELGRDADTGGQILYVVELARSLARQRQVGKVDLLTRRDRGFHRIGGLRPS